MQNEELTTTIQAIWINRSEAGYRSDWMPLQALRNRLASYEDVTWTRDQIDAALTHLLAAHTARLIPESNQKTLTPADRDAAIWLGGQYRHLISFAK